LRYKALKSFIVNELLILENPEDISLDEDLFSLGLTSIRLMRLIVYLEDTFQITIKPEEVIPDHFMSIEKISEMMKRKQSESCTKY
jgi:acyl carrier protein